MTEFEKHVEAMIQRYRGEVRDLVSTARTLPPGERTAANTHANVKESCANELSRLMDRYGVKRGHA